MTLMNYSNKCPHYESETKSDDIISVDLIR